jgi:hypothetical protein
MFSDYYTVLWERVSVSLKIIHSEISLSFKFKRFQNPKLKPEIIAVLLTNESRVIKCQIQEWCGSLLRKVRPPESALQILTALYLSCIFKHHNSREFLLHRSAINQVPVELWCHCPFYACVFSIVSTDISETAPYPSPHDTLFDDLCNRKSLN